MLTDKNGKKLDSSLGSINYRTHIQSKGWEKSYIKDGAISGTVGKGLRLEAIQIQLVYKDTPAPGATIDTFKCK